MIPVKKKPRHCLKRSSATGGLSMVITLLLIGCWLSGPSLADPGLRRITDRSGRTIWIPGEPKRVACLFGPSYEKLLALGAADRVVMVPNVALPWCHVINPGLKTVPVLGNYSSPEVEALLRLKADLVIYHPFAKQLQYLTAAGLPVAVAYDGSRRMHTLKDFIRDWYDQILFYGELLGGQAPERAKAYCAWADQRLQRVISVTSKIPEAGRPRVFWFCGRVNGPAGTQTRYATADWLVTAAGGTMLTHDDPAYFICVSAEEMVLWDPDIILVSTLASIDSVVNHPLWKHLRAVRNGKVFMSPQGQFHWSHFSTESFLCVLFLAQKFHPDLFSDLDLVGELKAYYHQFYHYDLTTDQAQRILAHLPPKRDAQARTGSKILTQTGNR